MDREYLSHYDRQPVDSEIHYQKPFDAPKDREIFYPITEDEPEDHATYLSVNTVVGDDLDPILYMAFQILGRVPSNPAAYESWLDHRVREYRVLTSCGRWSGNRNAS